MLSFRVASPAKDPKACVAVIPRLHIEAVVAVVDIQVLRVIAEFTSCTAITYNAATLRDPSLIKQLFLIREWTMRGYDSTARFKFS